MLVHDHPAPRQGVAPRRLFDLQPAVADLDRVVAVHRPLLLHRKDALQILPAQRNQRAAWLRRRNAELLVELGDVFFPQKTVRFLHRANSAHAQLLRESPWPGAKISFPASTRLRRIGRDHANSQLSERPSHLRQPLRIHFPAGFWRLKKVAGAVAVEGAKHALPLNHFAQCRHHRSRRFLVHQLRVVNLAGRVRGPASDVVAALPAFHVAGHLAHCAQARLDDVRARQPAAQQRPYAQAVQRGGQKPYGFATQPCS